MPKLPILSGKEIIKILKRIGSSQLRQKKSHVSMKLEIASGTYGCVVPIHKEVAIGTLRGILKQAHLTEEEFLDKYKG